MTASPMTADPMARLREIVAGIDDEDFIGQAEWRAAISLLRFFASDEAVEKLARVIDPDTWEQIDRDAYLLPDKPKVEWVKAQQSLAKARACLALIAGECLETKP